MTLSERIIAAGPGEAREVLELLWDVSPHAWASVADVARCVAGRMEVV